jgi:hypothetical protein
MGLFEDQTIGDILRQAGFGDDGDVKMSRTRIEELCTGLEEIAVMISADQHARAAGLADGMAIGLRTYLKEDS